MSLAGSPGPLVEVDGLSVSFGPVRAVENLSFTLARGAALALVGESGSGKSTVASSLLGLHRDTGTVVGGSVRVAGTDVGRAGDKELRQLRGGTAAMVFQDPLSSLDPYFAIGDQMAEVYGVHRGATRKAARARAVEVLDRVGIPDAARRSRSRPHEFSGGMRQRALIAMALSCEPGLLIADVVPGPAPSSRSRPHRVGRGSARKRRQPLPARARRRIGGAFTAFGGTDHAV